MRWSYLDWISWRSSFAAAGSQWQQHEYLERRFVRKEEPASLAWLELTGCLVKLNRASIFDGFFLLRQQLGIKTYCKKRQKKGGRGGCWGVEITAWKLDICSNWYNWTRLRLIYLIFSFPCSNCGHEIVILEQYDWLGWKSGWGLVVFLRSWTYLYL